MARRFSRLEQVRLLTSAAQRYEQWDDQRATRQPRVGQGTARGRSIRVVVTPFGFDPGAGGVVVRATQRSNAAIGGSLGTRISTTVGTDDRPFPGFKPAKVIVFQAAGNSIVRTSDITGLQYLRRQGESYTHPFGASSNTDKEIEALEAITTALIAANGNRTVSYQPESQRKI